MEGSPQSEITVTETPKQGDFLILTNGTNVGVESAVRDENGAYQKDFGLIDPMGATKGVKKVSLTYAPESGLEDNLRNLPPKEFRQMRAEDGTGPGGVKTPMYAREPIYARYKGMRLDLAPEAQIEVVDVQTDEAGNSELVFRYVAGPALLFPGGDPNIQPSVPIQGILAINGKPNKEYFAEQQFMLPYSPGIANRLKKAELAQKTPPKGNLLARIFHRK